MRSIVLYLHMHQPYRIKNYDIFGVGKDHEYWTDKDWHAGTNNERIFKKIAKKSYLPMLALLAKCLARYPKFRFSLSLTGPFLEQAEKWVPEVIVMLKDLTDTGRVEILGETYYHSLAFFYDRDEFTAQVQKHATKIHELFDKDCTVFRNTELAYNNDLARWLEDAGYYGTLIEGWEKALDGKRPNHVQHAEGCENLRLLCKNYKLSDDLAFRFVDKTWKDWPLSTDKYITWLRGASEDGPLINLFMDFETFGENIWEDTGIFEFFEELVRKWSAGEDQNFLSVSEACRTKVEDGAVSVPWTLTWADSERDLSAWLGNSMQHEALMNLYDLRAPILATNDTALIEDWRRMTTSDMTYYMCTKHLRDGGVHNYFSPYESPFDAFLSFMNVMRDIKARLAEKDAPNTQP